jgi:acyl-homoserine-lactone acylase
VADLYAEQVVQKGDSLYYRYNDTLHPVKQHEISLRYRTAEGVREKKVKAYFTHHGPVMAKRNGQWMSVKANNRSLNALVQSWQRTKSKGFESFKKNMELLSNSSNNTVFADNQGNIAYWHGNFIPRRDTSFNWSQPVDGSITATEWQGLHRLAEMIHLYNPASGWIQNCNSTPYTSAGASSPQKEDYPFYMATEPENFRGMTAARLLPEGETYTIDKIIAVGYNTYLAAFEELIPALVQQFKDSLPKDDTLFARLAEPVDVLQKWDLRSNAGSVATTLAIEWIERFRPYINRASPGVDFVQRVHRYAIFYAGKDMLKVLAQTVDALKSKYGTWQVPWGNINRYQRLSGDLQLAYDDNQPSLPVGMAAATWGCIPSFLTQYYPNTQKRYGYHGNSFVCAVEFGKKVKAKSLLTGGESSHPSSPHFADQADMYTQGKFKDVLFYKEDVLKHAKRKYHPGEGNLRIAN